MKTLSCWIIYNGNLLQEKFLHHVRWLQKEAKKRGIEAEIIKNTELLATFENGEAVIKGKYAGSLPDFVIFWDKDVRLAAHLENCGLRVFNSSRSIAVSDDKTLTYELLSNKGIPMAKTIIAPFVYGNMKAKDIEFYNYVEEELGYPMIIKEAFGSFGAQVYMVSDREELILRIKEIGSKPYLFQQYIKSSHGRDIRLNVVGDKVVASMLRRSSGDFRANISAGGTMEAYSPTDKEKELAVKCTKLIGADFAGVDLLFDENEEPILCEINSNAHMKNIYDCTGVDVAEYILDYIINKLEDENE
ncbi:ATP-grasp domain-containing protein [Clostridium polynesiense]|uniref:ATP-grasp domain-containing protein n=1 Tax=Clostridium polynesiense TaxID=1325933 RepID=UPI00058D96BA|nr:RimK family alpha-L-glutamate ligase [Clostridium polynesiense]